MKINTSCPGCSQTIYPYFYIQYFQDRRDDVSEWRNSNKDRFLGDLHEAPTNISLMINYYDSGACTIVAAQMYHLSCFLKKVKASTDWRKYSGDTMVYKISFPVFNPSFPQNFPRSHLRLRDDQYKTNSLLQALQLEIEKNVLN